ncbi:enolase C-terminal domain-like protein [Sporocytophaga myxococcoides]|uniref:enolase C-terminal domain-like protein n=1 Tax=Sporocytophaga myxococcoides TaxID=153721 RepID=UPI0012E02F05|nr:enolase C-terminal domain-like protein [Sporocytophaga myxococcoides]
MDDLQNLLNFTQICNSLRFGIESAYIHFLSKIQNLPVYSFLGLDEPKNIFTAYTLPIMQIGEIQSFYKHHQLERFKYLKLKINSENGFDLLKEVRKLSAQSIMIDANESWQNVEELIKFLEKIKKDNIVFVEQPLPYNFEEEYKYLKQNSTLDIYADESITDKADFSNLSEQFHGINMKLMKSGGYLNGIRLLKDAKKHGLKTMIGCMIETSLGISSAMNLCSLTDYNDLDGFFIIDNEPFNLLTEKKGQLFYSKT